MTIRILSILVAGAASIFAQPQAGDFHGMKYDVAGRTVFNKQVKGSPYSAQEVTETSQTLPDGSHIKTSVNNQVYRDVEGRLRMERTFARSKKAVTIVDPVANAQYEIDGESKTARKMNFHTRSFSIDSQNAQTRVAPPPGGPGRERKGGPGANARVKPVVESLGHQSFEGVDAEGTRMTTTIPAGTIGNDAAIQIVSERWYSADLQTTVMSKHIDPRSGETVFRLANISRANPDSSLFQVPSDYTVKEPSSKAFPGHRPPPAQ